MPAPPRVIASSSTNKSHLDPSSTNNTIPTSTTNPDRQFDPRAPPLWTTSHTSLQKSPITNINPSTTHLQQHIISHNLSQPSLHHSTSSTLPTHSTPNLQHPNTIQYSSSLNTNNHHLAVSSIPTHSTTPTPSALIPISTQLSTNQNIQSSSHNPSQNQSHSLSQTQTPTMSDHPFVKQEYDPRYNALVPKNSTSTRNVRSANLQQALQPNIRSTTVSHPPQALQALPSVSHPQHLTPDQVAVAAATGTPIQHNGHMYSMSLGFPQSTPGLSPGNTSNTTAVQYQNTNYVAAQGLFDPLISTSILPAQSPQGQQVAHDLNRSVNRTQQQPQQIIRQQTNQQQVPNQKKQQTSQQVQQQHNVRRQQQRQVDMTQSHQQQNQTVQHQQVQQSQQVQQPQQPQQQQIHSNRRQSLQVQQNQAAQHQQVQQLRPVQQQFVKGHLVSLYSDQTQQFRQLQQQQQAQQPRSQQQTPNQTQLQSHQTPSQSQPPGPNQQPQQQSRTQHPRPQPTNAPTQQMVHHQVLTAHPQQDLQSHALQQQRLQPQMYQPLEQSATAHHLMLNQGTAFLQQQNQVGIHNQVSQLQPNARMTGQEPQFDHHAYQGMNPTQMGNITTVGLHQQGNVSAQKGLSVSQQHELFGWGNNTTAGRNVASAMAQPNSNDVATGVAPSTLINPNGFAPSQLFDIGVSDVNQGVRDVRHANPQPTATAIPPPAPSTAPSGNATQKPTQQDAGASSNVRKASPNGTGVSPRKRRQTNSGAVQSTTTRLSAIAGARSFTCSSCGEEFSAKRDRDNHVRTNHERSFSCNQCPSKFKTKSDANRHIRIVHERRRPFQCPSCSSTFSERNKLRRHQDTVHEKKRPHTCPVCNARFGELGNLRQHTTSLHPDVTIDPAEIRARSAAENNAQIQS